MIPALAESNRAGGAGSGLVSDSTSDTHLHPLSDFCNTKRRFKRFQYNVIACSAMLNAESMTPGFRTNAIFITLTYRNIGDENPLHITEFNKRVRQHLTRRGVQYRYVWVAELQVRGALHYHLIVWLPHGYRLPKPDKAEHGKKAWWPHGWSNIKAARSPVGYLAHYAGKLKGKGEAYHNLIPKGVRIYGVGGMNADARQRRTWANLPGWLRCRVVPAERPKRIQGGGFVCRENGDYWPSPFRLKRVRRSGLRTRVSLESALPEGLILCSPYLSQKL